MAEKPCCSIMNQAIKGGLFAIVHNVRKKEPEIVLYMDRTLLYLNYCPFCGKSLRGELS